MAKAHSDHPCQKCGGARRRDACGRVRCGACRRRYLDDYNARNRDVLAAGKHQRYLRNEAEVKQKSKQWREQNRERYRISKSTYKQRLPEAHRMWNRSRHLRKKYGLTEAAYNRMLAAQNGLCAICAAPPNGKTLKLYVDHDASTAAIRGLLCQKCNSAIGFLSHNPAIIRRAADYVEQALLRSEGAA